MTPIDSQLALISGLTFIIHLVSTAAYSVYIAGTRTKRIAIALQLFNVLTLVTRISIAFQVPLLAKRLENNLKHGTMGAAEAEFRWLLAVSALAIVVGVLLIPTCQRLVSRALQALARHRSFPHVVRRTLTRDGLAFVRESLRLPAMSNVTGLHRAPRVPTSLLVLNTVGSAMWMVGTFASLYAGYLRPDLRATAISLAWVINGVGIVGLVVLVDPYLAVLTDDVVEGRVGDPFFRRAVVWLTASRLAGALFAQALLMPSAILIARMAERF